MSTDAAPRKLRLAAVSLGMVLGVGFLHTVSLVFSDAMAAVGKWWAPWFGELAANNLSYCHYRKAGVNWTISTGERLPTLRRQPPFTCRSERLPRLSTARLPRVSTRSRRRRQSRARPGRIRL